METIQEVEISHCIVSSYIIKSESFRLFYSHLPSQLPKNSIKSHIPKIVGENLNFGLFSAKIRKIQFFVTLKSLKRHCDVK